MSERNRLLDALRADVQIDQTSARQPKREEIEQHEAAPASPVSGKIGGNFFGLRDWLLGSLGVGASPAVPAIAEPEPESVVHPPGTCQQCGYPGPVQHIANVTRCPQCGLQSRPNQAPGISRKDLSSYSGGNAKWNPPTFLHALVRLGRR
jgi:hypothetical protein